MSTSLIITGVIAFLIVILAVIIITAYKKVAPNEVLIVTGGFLAGPYVQTNPQTHTKVKVVTGGGTFVIPIVQQSHIYSLDTFNIDVNVNEIMTKDAIPVDAAANAVLRPASEPQLLAVAAQKIFGLTEEERRTQMEQVVLGGVREVLAGLTPMEANNRSNFAHEIVTSIKPTFDNLGLEITALQITKLSDTHGYFESVSKPKIVDAVSVARQRTAEADKQATLVEAANNLEAQQGKLDAEKKIALSEKDVKIAKAQYQKEININDEMAAQAGVITKTEQDAIIKEKQIAVNENELKATKIAQQKAESEAKTIQANNDAAIIKINANANAAAIKTQAEAESDKINKIGVANAAASAAKIRETGKAQAEAQEKIANALSKHGENAIIMEIIKQLPIISQAYAESISNIDNLTVFDGAKGVTNQLDAQMIQSSELIKKATGFDLFDYLGKRGNGKSDVNLNLNDNSKEALTEITKSNKSETNTSSNK
jgi:flotillin